MSLQLQTGSKLQEDSSQNLNEKQKVLEYALSASSVKHFATNHVWIQDQNDPPQIVKWEPWQYHLDLFDIIRQYHHIYILKASQVGISWDLAIYNAWVANFNTTSKCLMLSQGQIEAQDLLSKVLFIHDYLPDYLKFPIDNSNREYISFHGTYSQIRALSSTDKAGHGFQATVVTRDEVARHEFARDNYKAVARSGAKLIELSTANKLVSPGKQAAYFGEKTYEFWQHPKTKRIVYPSGLELYTNEDRPKTAMVFLAWNIRPVRVGDMPLDEWWKVYVEGEYTPAEIEEQYPSCIGDVFKESGVRAYFDEDALNEMTNDICIPIKQEDIETYNGIVRIYKPPMVGRRYAVYTDPSLGRDDPSVTRVKDCATGERVASSCGVIKVDFAAQIHDSLVRYYNRANNSFEFNGSAGGEFAGYLRELGTPHIVLRRDHEGKVRMGYTGQQITPQLKKKMMERENLLLAKRQIINHDKEFIQQARRVMRDNDLPLMDKHQSFDWVMADAGLEWIDKFIPRSAGKVETTKYRRSG